MNIFYKKNESNEQGQKISENDLNILMSKIIKNDENSKYNKILAKEIERLKKL